MGHSRPSRLHERHHWRAQGGRKLTASNLIVDCDALSRVTHWDADTRVLVVLPIHHVNGLVVSCLQAWYVGASAVLCDRFRSETFWSDAEQHGITTSSLVPTLLEFLLGSGSPVPETLQEVYCGAGPLMTETVLSFE
ncbi:MAG: AMP-binding protein [Candidatus Promineifilaceae bacterium]